MTTTNLSRGGGRRRRWTDAEKARIVKESLAEGASVAGVGRRHGIHTTLIYAWRRRLRGADLSEASGDGVRFVSVAVSSDRVIPQTTTRGSGANAAVEVALRNGRILRIPDCVEPGRASALADALEGADR
jgi:transposase